MITEINVIAFFVAYVVVLPNGTMNFKNIVVKNYSHPFIWLREEIERNLGLGMSIISCERLSPQQLSDIEKAWEKPLPESNIIIPPDASMN